jgi:hypothetical protein
VLKQDLGGFFDPALVEPARSHVLQEGDVLDYSLGMFELVSNGHRGHLL